MKKKFLIFVFIFLKVQSLLALDLPSGLGKDDVQAVLKIIFKNISLVPDSSQTPIYEEISEDQLANDLWIWLNQKRYQKDLAFTFLYYLSFNLNFKKSYKEKILNQLHSYFISPEQQEIIYCVYSNIHSEICRSKESTTAERNDINQTDIFNSLIAFLDTLPSFFPFKNKMINSVMFLKMLIIPTELEDSCYNNNPMCMWSANSGIILYISKALENKSYLLDSIKFYAELANKKVQYSDAYLATATDFAQLDIWPIALGVTNNDKLRAIRVLQVFGHDECCNLLSNAKNSPYISLLNEIGTFDGRWNLNQPGAIDGVWLSDKNLAKYSESIEKIEKILNEKINLKAGYYHMIGGIFVASELLSNGFGKVFLFDTANIYSEALGYFYQKAKAHIHQSEEVKFLWESIHRSMQDCPVKPNEWSDQKFKLASAQVELMKIYIDYTQERHRIGAEWATKIYREVLFSKNEKILHSDPGLAKHKEKLLEQYSALIQQAREPYKSCL